VPKAVDRTERTAEITAAVERIATRDGFSSVTVRRVSEELGASTTAVTHYFASRDELVRSTVRRVIDRRTGELDVELADLQGRAAVRSMADWVALRPGDHHHRLWLAIVVGAAADVVLREELDRFNRWWDDRVERHLAEFEPPEPDPDGLADLLDVVLSGLVVAGLETESVWEQHRRRTVLDRLLTPAGLPPNP
jgi:AcrR family transcriptional regulator